MRSCRQPTLARLSDLPSCDPRLWLAGCAQKVARARETVSRLQQDKAALTEALEEAQQQLAAATARCEGLEAALAAAASRPTDAEAVGSGGSSGARGLNGTQADAADSWGWDSFAKPPQQQQQHGSGASGGAELAALRAELADVQEQLQVRGGGGPTTLSIHAKPPTLRLARAATRLQRHPPCTSAVGLLL